MSLQRSASSQGPQRDSLSARPTTTDIFTVETPLIEDVTVLASEESGGAVLMFQQSGLRLRVKEELGSGAFGRVFNAVTDTGEIFAVKISTKALDKQAWQLLREEITLMKHFSHHRNVVRFVASGYDGKRVYVVMERCVSKSASDILSRRMYSTDEILWIGRQVVLTILFIHTRGCIHRDLKPANLLFDFEGNVKISDFGLASRVSDERPRKTVAGTVVFMAPELALQVYRKATKTRPLDGEYELRYGKEVDVWSVGLVLLVLSIRRNPYHAEMEKLRRKLEQEGQEGANVAANQERVLDLVVRSKWSWPDDVEVDAELKSVVEWILNPRGKDRPTIDEIAQHPIWRRTPLSCPVSLLSTLGLVATNADTPMRQRSQSMTDMTPALKKPLEQHIQNAIAAVIKEEMRQRQRVMSEASEFAHILFTAAKLFPVEASVRQEIMDLQEFQRFKIAQMIRDTKPRERSVQLLPAQGPDPRRSARQPSVAIIEEQPGPASSSSAPVLLRKSADGIAVHYPGRDSSYKWNLRPCVSLPRDVVEAMALQDLRCMNKHPLVKFTTTPKKYNGFDCNVCGKGVVKLSDSNCLYRCNKCDYDVCMKCAMARRVSDVKLACITCLKKFPTTAKLEAHALNCRGPSLEPSVSRASLGRMHSRLWENGDTISPKSLASVSPNSFLNGLSHVGRLSEGPLEQSYDENSVNSVTGVNDQTVSMVQTTQSLRKSSVRRGSSVEQLLGPSRLSKRVREENQTAQEQLHLRSFAFSSDKSPNFVTRHDPEEPRRSLGMRREDATAALPPEVFSEPIGICAQRAASRARESSISGAVALSIPIDYATLPRDTPRQQGVPKKSNVVQAKSVSAAATSAQQAAAIEPAVAVSSAPRVHPTRSPPNFGPAKPQVFSVPPPYRTRLSIEGPVPSAPPRTFVTNAVVGANGVVTGLPSSLPPLPSMNRASSPRPFQLAAPALMPQQRAGSIRGSSVSIPASVSVTPKAFSSAAVFSNVSPVSPVQPLQSSPGSYLALPREQGNRQTYLEQFLGGPWVRFFAFGGDGVSVINYSLQPGRYGCLFAAEGGMMGTIVVDIHHKQVLVVRSMSSDQASRTQPHPHVQTFFEDDVQIMSLTDANRQVPVILNSVMSFVHECTRVAAEGLGEIACANLSVFVKDRDVSAVAANTKFAYLRKAFPDRDGGLTLFRLSNLRSQVISITDTFEIRWQSDRNAHIGQKYYVYCDGTAVPFLQDDTGTLDHMQLVIANSFHKKPNGGHTAN